MNSDEIWLLQLWSGTFGGAISAVAAALVAVGVLYFSNKHQTKLAKIALRSAEKQARKQLAVQREEASKERGIHAIAALIAELDRGLTELHDASMKHEDLAAFRVNLTNAAARWRMEVACPSMQVELDQWPELIFVMARDLVNSTEDSRDRLVKLALGCGFLRDKAVAWYAVDGEHEQVASDLLKRRLWLDPRVVSEATKVRLMAAGAGLTGGPASSSAVGADS